MERKDLGFYNVNLWSKQLHQMEMMQKSIKSAMSVCPISTFGITDSGIQCILESPMIKWINQNETWISQLNAQIEPILTANDNIKGFTDSVCKFVTPEYMSTLDALAESVTSFPYDQFDYNKMFGIASQISPVLKNLDLSALTSNIERIYDQLSSWETSADEVDYDDISVNDDGSLCYQDQCVTQPEINDIWDTFIRNCENLGNKAIEAIKGKMWVVQWILKFICIVTTLGLYKDIEEHIYKGALEVRSHARGWDKMFFVKKDTGARVYSDPDSKSNVLGRLEYEQKITAIDIQPFWIKFEYEIAEGKTVEAWVAICNLIRYDKLQNNHMALLDDEK